MSICSIRIRSRNWNIFEKPLQLNSNPYVAYLFSISFSLIKRLILSTNCFLLLFWSTVPRGNLSKLSTKSSIFISRLFFQFFRFTKNISSIRYDSVCESHFISMKWNKKANARTKSVSVVFLLKLPSIKMNSL